MARYQTRCMQSQHLISHLFYLVCLTLQSHSHSHSSGYEPSPYSEDNDDEGCGKMFSDGQDEDEGEDEEEDDIEVESENESERVVHVNEGNTGCYNVRGEDCVEGKGDKGEREGDKVGKEEVREKDVVADISPASFDGLTKPSDRCLLRTKSVH